MPLKTTKNLYLLIFILINGDIMKYDSGQASAEFILLFGGIIVVVLLAIFMYRNYINDLGGEIKSSEVNELTNKLGEISEFFT